MPRKSKLPRGLTRTPTGWRVRICVNGRWVRRRYPADVPLPRITQILAELRSRTAAGRRPAGQGTLRAEVDRYLEHFYKGRPGYEERKRHLNLWVDALGESTWRLDITREDVSRVLHQWLAEKLNPATINKRRTALMAMWHALDGKSATNPARDTAPMRVEPPEPRGLDYPTALKALKTLTPSRTRARLLVMLTTGARPVQIRRLEPADITAEAVILRATAKGAGTRPVAVPLSEDAKAALKEFTDTKAWGEFSSAPIGRIVKKVLPGVKVYDLRHTFGTAVYGASGDLRAVQALMGHASMTMTSRYTLAAVPARLQAVVGAAFGKAE